MHNNMNVNVSGPQQPSSTYKTVVLKGQVPFATQVTEPDMKYVIKHDFDLNGASVTVPAGCVLQFDGGSLSNGTVVFDNTELSNDIRIYTDISGVLKNTDIEIGWFGAVGDSKTDNYPVFQRFFGLTLKNKN